MTVSSGRLNKMLDRFKRLVNKLLSEEGMVNTLKLFEATTTRTCSFYHDSFNSYINDSKICFKRKLLCFWCCFVNFFAVIYFLICLIKSDRDTLRRMGSPVVLITKHYNIMNASALALACFKCIAQLSSNLYEARRHIFMIELVNKWIVSTDLFGLNNDNTRKLIRRGQSVYWLAVICMSLVKLIIYILSIVYILLAYFKHDFSLIPLIPIMIMVNVWYTHLLDQEVAIVFFMYTTITYLSYKFDEHTNVIKLRIRWNNDQGIIASIEDHDYTVRLTNQLAILYNTMIGYIYLLLPYVIALFIDLLFVPDFTFIVKVMVFACILGGVTSIYFVNHISSSITVRNDKLLEYLFRTNCHNTNLNLLTKLKLENFLVELKTGFIGFYCFNWFKFTRLSFFQYTFTITSAYILVTNMFK